MQEGIVLSAPGGVYDVLVGNQRILCSLRHHIVEADERHRDETKEMPYVDLAAAGDRVQITPPAATGGRGYIEEILPRSTRFGRTRMDGWRQIIVANLDVLLIVFAARHPQLKLRMLDRFLVTAEASGLRPVIIINKMDLVEFEDLKQQMKLYEDMDYTVLYTSAQTGTGIEEIRAAMTDRISAFVGSSGVGKSSLIKTLLPGVDIERHPAGPATSGRGGG